MTDREKVIKGLTGCVTAGLEKACPADCPYFLICFPDVGPADPFVPLMQDALALLKQQEPIKPTINEYGEAYCICGENVGIIPNSKNLPKIRLKYCPECGRRMKWE